MRGYHLSKFDVTWEDDDFFGFRLHFDPDVTGSGSTIISTNFGDVNNQNANDSSFLITKRVKSVRMVRDKGQRNMVLTYVDGTKKALISGNNW